jgi:hypothetical protein
MNGVATHQVNGGDKRLAGDDRLCVIPLVLHLADNVEKVGCAGVGEDHHRDCIDGVDESGVACDGGFGTPEAHLRGSRRTILDTDSDGEGDDGGHDPGETDPSDDADTVEGLDRREDDVQNGSDHHKRDWPCQRAVPI